MHDQKGKEIKDRIEEDSDINDTFTERDKQ